MHKDVKLRVGFVTFIKLCVFSFINLSHCITGCTWLIFSPAVIHTWKKWKRP